MIDEVDKIQNNEIFIEFLSVLRQKYLDRDENIGASFHSVILDGVYDIRNLIWEIKKSKDYKELEEAILY